eukprot:2702345-Prymnesium_polylepis.1
MPQPLRSAIVLLDGHRHDVLVVPEARRRVFQRFGITGDGGRHDRLVVPEALRRVTQCGASVLGGIGGLLEGVGLALRRSFGVHSHHERPG